METMPRRLKGVEKLLSSRLPKNRTSSCKHSRFGCLALARWSGIFNTPLPPSVQTFPGCWSTSYGIPNRCRCLE